MNDKESVCLLVSHSFLSHRQVGIPLDDEGHEGLLSDDDGYFSEEEMFAGSAVQRPSYVRFM